MRRFGVLVLGLPRESSTQRAELGEAAEWGVSDYLLATLIEVTDAVSWRPVMPHAKKGWKPPKPIEVPRPALGAAGEPKKKKRRKATSEDLARMFGEAAQYAPGGDAT